MKKNNEFARAQILINKDNYMQIADSELFKADLLNFLSSYIKFVEDDCVIDYIRGTEGELTINIVIAKYKTVT
ncbi:MAG: hypothetical protein RR086_05355 [Clostridia bacterium]